MRAVVVGAGLSGLTAARLLTDAGWTVEVYERRGYIGGNCADHRDTMTGLLVHDHGPHIFHTDYEPVWEFVNRFAGFNSYQHKVLANTSQGTIPIPINDVAARILGYEPTAQEIQNLVFRDYSSKMWGKPWSLLPESVTSRVPSFRKGDDCRYFLDAYQGLPIEGYTKMLAQMADGISIYLGEDNGHWEKQERDLLVYTGSIDEYFGQPNTLEYRTLNIRFSLGTRQGAAVINECNNLAYTRTTDYSAFYGLPVDLTVLSREYPATCSPLEIPFYPVHSESNLDRYRVFERRARGEEAVVFLGRLGTFRYMDMDDVIWQAMTELKPYLTRG